jgi:hypothetical protein
MSTVVQGLEVLKACEVMNELGIENTFNLTGGILLERRSCITLKLLKAKV